MKIKRLPFFDSQKYKGDCNYYFQCNEKFDRWRYYQETLELAAKHIIPLLGVNPLGSLRFRMKRKIMKNLNLLNFCSTFQSELNEIKKAVSKSLHKFQFYVKLLFF